jgi:hypothetical protein
LLTTDRREDREITDQQTVEFIKQQLAAFAKFIERMAPKAE